MTCGRNGGFPLGRRANLKFESVSKDLTSYPSRIFRWCLQGADVVFRETLFMIAAITNRYVSDVFSMNFVMRFGSSIETGYAAAASRRELPRLLPLNNYHFSFVKISTLFILLIGQLMKLFV